MLDELLTWTLIAPLIGGAVAALFLVAQNRKAVPPKYAAWLRLAAVLAGLAGLSAEVVLLFLAVGSVTFDAVGITLTIFTPARLVLMAANVALACAVLFAWTGEDEEQNPSPEWALILATVVSPLLAGAALTTERVTAALLLLGAALATSVPALARPRGVIHRPDVENMPAQRDLARRITGGLKHLSLAGLGSGLLMSGAVLVSRYALNLENRGLLQLGMSLLAIGLIVRSGMMPFAAANADMIESAPPVALMMLGAGVPIALVTGLLMFAPVEGSLVVGTAATGSAGLGALGTLLAGLRGLGVLLERRESPAEEDSDHAGRHGREAELIAMSVAAATGWAVFGILSGSRAGAEGAVLIAINIAVALPLLMLGSGWRILGVASLLGLPLLGGFSGTLLVAQSAANESGLWLALLMAGSALVAAGWLAMPVRGNGAEVGTGDTRRRLVSPGFLLKALLVLFQLALFLASLPLIDLLNGWATVPWLVGP